MRRRAFIPAILAAGTLPLPAETARPRLFLNAKVVQDQRSAIRTTHAGLWAKVRANADSYAALKPPEYPANPDKDDEQLWQREVGNKLPFLGLAYLLTGEAQYRDAAIAWSLASCGYPTWGTGIRDGVDLGAGHQLFGLALIYDWLYDALPEDARAKIRETLLVRGGVMFHAANETAFWKSSFLQNHMWVNLTGLTAAALALDDPATTAWTALARTKFRATESNLGPDGASQEGVPYWTYGMEYMLKYWHLAGDAWGERPTNVWWNKTAAYRIYLGLPRNSWTPQNTLVDIADGPRADYYGPDYVLRRLASLHRDPYAQWLAGELDRAGVTNAAARWLNLLWYDPSVKEQVPAKLPILHHFEDIGIISARTNWQGDESLLVFKCGPPLGHAAVGKFDYDPGCGHVHPDENHFVIFGNGEWLLRDDGYAWKQTDQHNTLLVDGVGQLGEGGQWFRGIDPIRSGARPRILKANPADEYDELIGDATSIYPGSAALKRFRRRLLFWKPNIVLVLDDIETAGAKKLELRFHPELPLQPEDDSLLGRGRSAAFRVRLLTPDGVMESHGKTAAKTRDGRPSELFAIRYQANRSNWRNVVALSWSDVSENPPQVAVLQEGDSWVFYSGKRQLRVRV